MSTNSCNIVYKIIGYAKNDRMLARKIPSGKLYSTKRSYHIDLMMQDTSKSALWHFEKRENIRSTCIDKKKKELITYIHAFSLPCPENLY